MLIKTADGVLVNIEGQLADGEKAVSYPDDHTEQLTHTHTHKEDGISHSHMHNHASGKPGHDNANHYVNSYYGQHDPTVEPADKKKSASSPSEGAAASAEQTTIASGAYAHNPARDTAFARVAKAFAQTVGLAQRERPELGGFYVTKDARGQMRWFARYSNAWEDRDKEILTEAAHKEYVDWANSPEGVMPELWLWHTKGTRFGVADWVDFSDGFAHASGVVDDTPQAKQAVEFLASQKELGVSHGFLSVQDGKYVNKYRSFEISVLPRDRAAVWTTDFNVLGKETELMAFNPDRRKWLVDALGEDTVKRLEETTETSAKQLKELGVEYKEAEEAKAAEPAAVNGEVIKIIGQQMVTLTEQVGQLAASVKEVKTLAEKNRDDVVSDEFLARLSGAIGKRPTESAANVVTEKEAAAAGVPVADSNDFFAQMLKNSFGVPAGQAGVTPGTPAAGAVTIQ